MTARTMPVLFVGHGSPMNTIEHNAWSDAWRLVGAALPRPRAILCVSAHWETAGPQVTGSASPATIHDFYGFPQALFDVRYPAPGDPALARRVVELLGAEAGIDPERGLDHGAWSVLLPMFPAADIPVVQLGIDTRRDGAWHYAVARRLGVLRDEGVLILCSGNIVHNLRLFRFNDPVAYDWATRFDEEVAEHIATGHHEGLLGYETLGTDALLAIPTPEHYLPLLYVLALQRDDDPVEFFNENVTSSISMRSVQIGES